MSVVTTAGYTDPICICGSTGCHCDISSPSRGKRAGRPKLSLYELGRAIFSSYSAGSDLRNTVLPLAFLDSRSSLQKGLAALQRARSLERISETHNAAYEDVVERLLSVAAFVLSGLPRENFGKRPFTPVEHEIFRACCLHDDSKTVFFTEQVSLQPAISASLIRNDALGIEVQSFAIPKTRLGGTPPNSLLVQLDGYAKMTVRCRDGKVCQYIITRPTFAAHGILNIGDPYVAFQGSLEVVSLDESATAKSQLPKLVLKFAKPVWRNSEEKTKHVTGSVTIKGVTKLKLQGRWDGVITGNGRVVWDDALSWKQDRTDIRVPSWAQLEESGERNSLVVWRDAGKAVRNGDQDAVELELQKVAQKYGTASRHAAEVKENLHPSFFEKIDDPDGPFPFYYKFRDSDPAAKFIISMST